MPMKVKVGLAKKVGQPDFGSLGASCDIELELDGGLLFHDLQELQEKIQSAYIACRQAVNDELASQRSTPPCETPAGNSGTEIVTPTAAHPRVRNSTRVAPSTTPHTARNGPRRAATTSQVRALHTIATRQGFNLTDLLRDQFELYRAEDLSLSQASRLIDDLNGSNVTLPTNRFGGKA